MLTACLTFFSIPIFIRDLGMEQYGIYSLLTVLGNLNTIANLGLNTTLVKSLSSQGKCKQSDHDIIVTVCFVAAISIPVTVVALLSEKFVLTSILNIPDKSYAAATLLYKCILIANIGLLLGQTLVAILDSLGKIYITNSFQFVYNCIYWLGTIVAVKLGYELNGVGVVALLAVFVWILLLFYACSRNWGNISKDGLKENFKPTLSKQLSHGIKIFSGGLLSILIEPISKILTGNLVGVREVGYLEIAYKVRTQIWGFILKAVYPIFPIVSSGESAVSSKGLIVSTQKNLLLFIIPCGFLIIFVFPFLIRLWLGADTPDLLIQTVTIIVTAYLVSSIAIPAYFTQLAFLPTSIIYGHIAYFAINILISTGLYKHYGYQAIIWGNSIGIFTAFLINIYMVNVKALNSKLNLRVVFKYALCLVLLLFINVEPRQIQPGFFFCGLYGIRSSFAFGNDRDLLRVRIPQIRYHKSGH